MDSATWIMASQHVPTQVAGYVTSELVLVVIGVTRQEMAVAYYDHREGKWKGDAFGEYGQHVERLVTHWMPLPDLPAPLPTGFVTSLEPDFISEDTPMRALFSGVEVTEKQLQQTLRETIADTGVQGVHIQTCGSKRDCLYYVDFWVRDPLELQAIKQRMDQLDVPYTLTAKQKKR